MNKIPLIVIIIAMCSAGLFAAEPIIINNDTLNDYPIGLHMDILRDKDGALTIHDLIDNKKVPALRWEKSTKELPGFSYTTDTF